MYYDERLALIDTFVNDLPSLRAKLGISQNDLAFRVGVSRQTINAVEIKKRELTWQLFLALFLFFVSNEATYEYMKLRKGFISSVYKWLSVEIPNSIE
jgi:DNA-binding XRE family transcriptional regulator